MSGHSKWATTKRQKGAADAKRGALFTKLANQITVAAREGGDPEMNFKLRLAIDLAKANNVPKDNIERAIARGTGAGSGGQIESIAYEGFGPDGIAMIIEALTDNRNRTSSNVKHLLAKHGGSLGGPNTVGWLFAKVGTLRVDGLTEDQELSAIEAGAQDIRRDNDGVAVYTQPNDLQAVKKKLEGLDIPVAYAQVEWLAKEEKPVSDATKEALGKLFAELDEDSDINDYYTNAKP